MHIPQLASLNRYPTNGILSFLPVVGEVVGWPSGWSKLEKYNMHVHSNWTCNIWICSSRKYLTQKLYAQSFRCEQYLISTLNYICIMEIGCSRFWIVLLNWKRDRWCWNIQSLLLQWYWWVSTENFSPFFFVFWPHQCFLGAWTGAIWTIGWVVGYIDFFAFKTKAANKQASKKLTSFQ